MAAMRSAMKSAALGACQILGVNSLAHRQNRNRLLVVCYHGVVRKAQADRFRYANTTSEEEFDAHIAALVRDFHPISAADLIAWYQGGRLPEHPVMITFDDGYRNNLTLAAPILRRHKAPCLFHMTTSYIGTDRTLWTDEMISRIMEWPAVSLPLPKGGETTLPREDAKRRALASQCKETCKRIPWEETCRYLDRLRAAAPAPEFDPELYQFLNWDEVRALRDQGFEIGSHTIDHPILTQLPPDELRRQLVESRQQIERETGGRCRVIAYPNGGVRDFSPAVEEAAREAGYEAGLTIIEDFNEGPADAMAVKRLCIMGHLPLSSFSFRISGAYRLGR